jgi:Zn-dependent metalloprotease
LRENAKLVIVPVEGGSARLAWQISFSTEHQAGIKPTRMRYFIDAHDGTLVDRYNSIHTAVVQGSGPGGNTRVPRTWTNELDVNQSGSTYTMDTPTLKTVNLNKGTSGGTTVSSSSTTFNDAAADDAHGFAEVTLGMLKNWFGYDSIDNKGFKIVSRVHYSSNYENAFWDGEQMTYGDGGSTLFQMAGSLDVVAHEIDHGFTEFNSGLTYSGQSGGMNESFSDIAGTAAKFYYNTTKPNAVKADFNLGGDIFRQANQYIRYMCNPTQDGGSIDNAKDYNSSLDVHYTSGVMNKAFCRAAKRLSGVDPGTGTATADGVRKAAKAWFQANDTKWTSSTNWVQGCQGVVDSAKELGYSSAEIDALGKSWADVGVSVNATSGTTCKYTTGTCTPQCTGKTCGSDGCGGSCGTCGTGQTCNSSGQCTGGTCTPQCSGKSCGPDGCGGTCGTCGSGQTCSTTGQCQGTPTQCAHDLCKTGTKLTSGCETCVTTICKSDSYCCNTEWDNQCVGEVASICKDNRCTATPPPPTCAHDKCKTGVKLTSTCDPCVGSICAKDSYCCVNKWDGQCVGEVASICKLTCN